MPAASRRLPQVSGSRHPKEVLFIFSMQEQGSPASGMSTGLIQVGRLWNSLTTRGIDLAGLKKIVDLRIPDPPGPWHFSGTQSHAPFSAASHSLCRRCGCCRRCYGFCSQARAVHLRLAKGRVPARCRRQGAELKFIDRNEFLESARFRQHPLQGGHVWRVLPPASTVLCDLHQHWPSFCDMLWTLRSWVQFMVVCQGSARKTCVAR